MEKKLVLSDQAIGAVMMALQKGLIEQVDVTDVFRGFEFEIHEKLGLVVLNPPTFEIKKEQMSS